jgi:tryptophanyl-tRNA synthetase
MIKQALELQDQGETLLFIADYHALTTMPKPEDLRERVKSVAVDFLACGINPEKTLFFRQSDVAEVTELTWILNSSVSVGLLERAHSYKDKVARGITPNNGLFSYPVLMAADILIYDSNVVPVGKDQKQHVEITRDLAIKFNQTYGDVFVVPEPRILESVAVVPGLDGQKMSKSYNNTIEIFGDEKAVRKKVMSMVTDSKRVEEPKDPSACNIFALYKLFADEGRIAEMERKYREGNYGYGHAKQELFSALREYFAPQRKRREELIRDPGYVESVLREAAGKARALAGATLERVRKAVGLR